MNATLTPGSDGVTVMGNPMPDPGRIIMSSSASVSPPGSQPKAHRDKTQYLYMAVIVAMLAGIAFGFLFAGKDGLAVQLKPLGTGFISLIKMIITPIIFCTLVLGIGS